MTTSAPSSGASPGTRSLAERIEELAAQAPSAAPSTDGAIEALRAEVMALAEQLAEVRALVDGLVGEIRTVVEDSALQVVSALLPAQRPRA